jgi:hypothetical protein
MRARDQWEAEFGPIGVRHRRMGRPGTPGKLYTCLHGRYPGAGRPSGKPRRRGVENPKPVRLAAPLTAVPCGGNVNANGRHDGAKAMIEARQLTRRYGDKLAVDGLTFTVRPGVVSCWRPRQRPRHVIRSEWTKLRSLSSTIWCLLAMVTLVVGVGLAYGCSTGAVRDRRPGRAVHHRRVRHRIHQGEPGGGAGPPAVVVGQGGHVRSYHARARRTRRAGGVFRRPVDPVRRETWTPVSASPVCCGPRSAARCS